MRIKAEFREMITELAERFSPPPIADVFFPPFHKGGQPKDAQFMAIRLEGGATGISFLLLSDEDMDEYIALQVSGFVFGFQHFRLDSGLARVFTPDT